MIGGFIPSSFVTTGYPPRSNVFLALGGYEGAPLASAAYLGWSFLAVMVGGPRRPSGGTAACGSSASCSSCASSARWASAAASGSRPGSSTTIPVLENIIEQRFMAVGFLAAAVMLAIILDHVSTAPLPDWRGALGALARRPRWRSVPDGRSSSASACPSPCRPVILPRWYSEVAPTLPPGRVLLSYPAPFSGLQSAMAWQAVNAHALQPGRRRRAPGGGAPGRLGAGGFRVLSLLGFGVGMPEPAGHAGAVRRGAPRARGVGGQHRRDRHQTPPRPPPQQGRDPVYAAAFMTAALGRLPTIAGRGLGLGRRATGAAPALLLQAGTLAACAGAAEKNIRRSVATMQVADCVSRRRPAARPEALRRATQGRGPDRPTRKCRARRAGSRRQAGRSGAASRPGEGGRREEDGAA